MPFGKKVSQKALVACSRRCCVCRRFCGKKMELHHIQPAADGGDDSFENCIPLCFFCHEEVGSYNPAHPKGKKFSGDELRAHRDIWYEFVTAHPERLSPTEGSFFQSEEIAVMASLEPTLRAVEFWSEEKGTYPGHVPAVKIRNQGKNAIYLDEVGLLIGGEKRSVSFTNFSHGTHQNALEIPSGHSRVFDLSPKLSEEEYLSDLNGIYVVTGTGHEFRNSDSDLSALKKSILDGGGSRAHKL